MLNSDNLLHLSGIVLTILISVSVISFTNNLIFGGDKIKKPISINQIYDPDFNLNVTHICIFDENVYSTRQEDSGCYNKTLLQWYNPWLRHHLWTRFWEEVENNKVAEEGGAVEGSGGSEEEEEVAGDGVEATESPPPKKDEPEPQKLKENSAEFVYSLLVGFLVMSVLAACWEVFRDKVKTNPGAGAKAQEKQCSLADFTINRHLRRESKQQAASHLARQASVEVTPKVTQNLIHQSSLDRAFPKISSEVISVRRNSVPSPLIINLPSSEKLPGPNVPGTPLPFRTKRQSVDVSVEEASPDSRKKSRHFIRRH